MDKEKLLSQLVQKDNTERWYLVGFFAVFIILILFVIRPNVNEYLRRQKLLEDLTSTNAQYDTAISNLRVLQGLFEEYRDQFPLLEEAVPMRLEAYNFAQDVAKIFLPYVPTDNLRFPGFNVGEKAEAGVPVAGTQLVPYPQSIEITGKYSELQRILSKLMNQRRIKHVTRVVFSENQTASGEASMGMRVDFQGYYIKN